MTSFDIDVDALGDDAAEIAGLASALDRCRQGLTSALHAEGPCWGDDESGQSFAAKYLPDVSMMEDNFASISAFINGIADALGQAASNAVGSDDRAQQRLA